MASEIRKQHTTLKKSSKKVFSLLGVLAVLIVLYFIFGRHIGRVFKHSAPRNVILITIDTLRADYLSCYQGNRATTDGKRHPHTPYLDGLAKEGVRFERCIAQIPLTLPSHTSILSGTYPLHHQVRDNCGFLVPQQLNLVSEVLKNEGFSTSAFVAAYVLHSKWGLDQGFDTYSDDFDATKYRSMGKEMEKQAEVVLNDARHWLTQHKEKPFFTWIHLFDPHSDYAPPAPYDKQYTYNPYAGEVAYVDAQLGAFFQFLKTQDLYDDTIIIVTSDHGEGLGEHNERTHGHLIYETTVWVPLIIRAHGDFAGKTVPRLVELVDIAPTILELMGFDIPKTWQGQSLCPLLEDPASSEWQKQTAYAETFYGQLYMGWSPLQAIYLDQWKYILAPKEELYNITGDAAELDNLAATNLARKKRLKHQLIEFSRNKSKQAVSSIQESKVSEKDRKRLESLGYLTTRVSPGASDAVVSRLPDPKDHVEKFEFYDNAMLLLRQGKYSQVTGIMEAALKKAPADLKARMILAVALYKSGSPGKAIPLLYEVLKKKPDYNDAMVNLLKALNSMGRWEQAVTEGKRFLELFPRDHAIYNQMGDACFFSGKLDDALTYMSRSLEIEPRNSAALLRIGEIYLEKKEHQKARIYIKKAQDIYPEIHNAFMFLGRLEEEQGNPKQALEHYQKELTQFPSNHIAAFHLAELLKKTGRYGDAIPYYRIALAGDPGFRLPYFMIANYYLESGRNLREAVELCKKGIRIQPADQATLFGYFILTNVLVKLGDQAGSQHYTREGEKLYKALQEKK